MLRRFGSAVGFVFVVAVFLSGCGSKPIVGVILPTTGAAASYGESIESEWRHQRRGGGIDSRAR
jgi:uncharacterized protein YceK